MTPKNYLKGYKLVFSDEAQRMLNNLEVALAQKIKSKLFDLVAGQENLDTKKLHAYSEPTFRLRVGHMRVIYTVWQHQITVFVIEIGHRKEIYKK